MHKLSFELENTNTTYDMKQKIAEHDTYNTTHAFSIE